MRIVTVVLALLCLWSCKKYTDRLNETATSGCKITSIEEFRGSPKINVTHTYTYANGRLSKWEIMDGGSYYYNNFFYNARGMIIYTTSFGSYRTWKYTDGVLTEIEKIADNGRPISRHVFTYTNGKLTKMDRLGYGGTAGYKSCGYDEITWENGNVTAVKQYSNVNGQPIMETTYTYYPDKENKQGQLTPQTEMLYYNCWTVDMFALMASKNLLKTISHTEVNPMMYELNEQGFISAMKGKNDRPYYNFFYDCSKVK